METVELVSSAIQAIGEQRFGDALAKLEQASAQDPDSPLPRHGLGLLALYTSEPVVALNLFNEAHKIAPSVAEHAEALAITYARLGKLHDALFFAKLSTALPSNGMPELLPAWLGRFADHFVNIKTDPLLHAALALQQSGKLEDAEAMFRREISLNPHSTDGWRGLAVTLLDLGKPFEALEALRGVVAQDKREAWDLTTIGRALAMCGRAGEGMALHDRASREAPADIAINAARLADLRYAPASSGALIAAAAQQWAATLPPRPEAGDRWVEPLADRKLRVGLLSGRLDSPRAAANALLPFLQRADLVGWELTVFSYSEHEDQLTRRLRHVAFDWVDITAIDDATAALMIENADLDLVIALDDIGVNRRPGLLLEYPNCPVVGWAEHPSIAAALGMRGVVGDRRILAGEDLSGLAASVTLPGALYGLNEETPEALPFRDDGEPRIIGIRAPRGHFTPANCALVADLLAALPGCLLLVDYYRVGGQAGFDDLVEQFVWHGCSDRIVTLTDLSPAEAERNFIETADVIVDLPPVSDVDGAVAALMKGRPVVTLTGATPSSRSTASALSGLGLEEWAVDDAGALASAVGAVLADRQAAQDRVLAAIAGGEAARPLSRAKALEQALRQVAASLEAN